MLHLGPIWYHSEPSDVPYFQNLLRPNSWFALFLQQNDSSNRVWLSYFTYLLYHLMSNSDSLIYNGLSLLFFISVQQPVQIS